MWHSKYRQRSPLAALFRDSSEVWRKGTGWKWCWTKSLVLWQNGVGASCPIQLIKCYSISAIYQTLGKLLMIWRLAKLTLASKKLTVKWERCRITLDNLYWHTSSAVETVRRELFIRARGARKTKRCQVSIILKEWMSFYKERKKKKTQQKKGCKTPAKAQRN